MPVPEPLRELLLQSNGVMKQTDFGAGRGFEDSEWIVDPVAEMIARFSSAEATGIFFFGGPGVDGVRFGFGDGHRFPAESIVAYSPFDGDVTLMAPDFGTFFQEWFAGRLTLAGWAQRPQGS